MDSSILSERNIKGIWAPKDAHLKGRIAAIQLRNETLDITIINLYLPAPSSAPMVFRKVLTALQAFLHGSPSQTIRIFMRGL